MARWKKIDTRELEEDKEYLFKHQSHGFVIGTICQNIHDEYFVGHHALYEFIYYFDPKDLEEPEDHYCYGDGINGCPHCKKQAEDLEKNNN